MSDVLIEIYGLELRGFHGALPEESQTGQPFLFDVQLNAHDAGVRSDKLGDTVDYTQVLACIREISDGHRFNLIEADRKSTRLNSSHIQKSRMPSSA